MFKFSLALILFDKERCALQNSGVSLQLHHQEQSIQVVYEIYVQLSNKVNEWF